MVWDPLEQGELVLEVGLVPELALELGQVLDPAWGQGANSDLESVQVLAREFRQVLASE